MEAARDLGWIGTDAADEAVPELMKALLEDKSENVRVEAALALQWIGTKAQEAVPALVQALNEDQSEKVRERAALVLQGMEKNNGNAVKALFDASKNDKSNQVREAAVKTLEKLAMKFEYKSTSELLKSNKIGSSK
ncbi:MAG: HEAT repeat domain-containing protein [Asgard group archaeon]|nr:HEAT repeat domain-containing protein [Asgard group archaeon]